MFRPTLVTAPEGTPVSPEDCKHHAVIDHSEDDALVQAYIGAATAHLDGFRGILGRAIMRQTWALHYERFERSFVLPIPDVSSVVIDYADADGLAGQVTDLRLMPVAAGTRVEIRGDLPAVESGNAAPIVVQFTCGFGDTPESVPWTIRVAIMQMARQMYDDRGGEPSVGHMVRTLIAPYRWVPM